MKCYYEELGIPRDANDADIKSAYRRLALRWHPDKNLECLEEAKERFQLIQQAYEVLSDAQERAWYDNHREQILRGKNSEYEDNCLDLFQYFTSSCFKGYGNDEKGFYAVYRKVFEKIACEDAEFLDDEDEISAIPSFGDANSSYEETVGPFYAYWSAYSTKRGYEWLCPYDIREIKDRRILREVEKEMKKIASKAKRERNEEVRNLVAFVRKRDRRVHAYRLLLEQRAEENRLKQEQNRIEKIRKRQQELKEMSQNSKLLANDDYEEQLKNLQQHYGGEESDEDGNQEESDNSNSDAEVVYDDLYCIACNKSFKNDKAFANHESSKKHREKVEKLRADMQREEEEFNENSGEDGENSCDEEIESEATDEDEDELLTSENEATDMEDNVGVDNNSEDDNNMPKDDLPNDATLDDDIVEETPTLSSSKTKNQNKRSDNFWKVAAAKIYLNEDSENSDTLDAPMHALKVSTDDEEEWNTSSNRKSNKNKKNKKPQNKTTTSNLEPKLNEDEEHSEEDWNATGKRKGNKNKKNKRSQNKPTTNSATNNAAAADSANEAKSEAIKDVVEGQATATIEPSESTKLTHVCVTCKASFPSKNKLFAHLKAKNHGVYIPKQNGEPNLVDTVKNKKSKNKRK